MKNSLHTLLKLTNFELERLSKFLFTLMGLTLLINLAGYIYTPTQYMGRINEYLTQNSATADEAVKAFGHFSFYTVTNTLWIGGPIALGISGLLFYSVFIWYREWFGKNTFAYRLLMLPVSRMTLYFSKFIVIFIGIFSLIATQMVSLFIGYPIVSAIIESPYFRELSLIESIQMNPLFLFFFPLDFGYFVIVNGVGFVVLLVLFTVILMERSFGVKGIVLGIVYSLIALAAVLLPLFLPDLLNNRYLLYGSELMIIETILLTTVGVLSLFMSRHLINKKITV
ncbi:hypothetical protein SAMN04488102_10886 [Alkalibacterium subtropicum]|uniref:ABC-2 family transporter protein n=1 Tax=Alkalibacterium subtropicum TaxID=753702 RepID=A0A1I1JPL0_9LACT|nr:hypothetical protein [Alkalibacterium subtropicum]SFC50494.1 hypothetical protein SAMN04488102_10886 [Alkalibacterium subtropicum]